MKNPQDLVTIQPELLSMVDRIKLDELDFNALVELGKGVMEVKTYSNWILGKLGDAVSSKYGDIDAYAKAINQNRGVLDQYIYAYRKYTNEDKDFSPDKYYGRVPWGLIQMVASKSNTPGKLLNELVDQGATTIPSGYRAIKEKESGQKVPRKPKINFKWDDKSTKWKIQLRPEDLDLIDWRDIKEQLLTYLGAMD